MALLEVFAEDRCPDCTELLRRVEALNSDLTYANATNARLSALNLQQEEQVQRLMEHLQHAVDERDALRVQVEAMTRDLIALAPPGPPLPRLSGPTGKTVCQRCLNFRRLGDDSDGGKPCPDCCCPDCGVVSGDGRPCASHGPTEDEARGCDRCGGARKVDAGEDELGEVVIPCDSCCCSVCGDYTGGGLCDADREAAP